MFLQGRFAGVVLVILMVLLAGCKIKPSPEYSPVYGEDKVMPGTVTQYTFGVHPLHNPRLFFEVYQPLVDYINSRTTRFHINLEASNDYSHFENKLAQRKFHFALPNPYQAVTSLKYGYKIFGKMGNDNIFTGLIIVRKDAAINTVKDLRGAEISFPSATAVAAAMMPKYFLRKNGLNVETEATCKYVGSQESVIMNVYLGKTKAGATWPLPWELFSKTHPEITRDLKIQWETEPLINNGLIVLKDIPDEDLKVFSGLLFNLHNDPFGKNFCLNLGINKFETISGDKYASVVNRFLTDYVRAFGSLPTTGKVQQ